MDSGDFTEKENSDSKPRWMELVSLGQQSIYEKENSHNKPTGSPGLGGWALG